MDNRWLVAGLGNPGKKYERTWHNLGFMALEIISQRYQLRLSKLEFKGLTADWLYAGNKVKLILPQTYMNNSGESVREALSFYKLPSSRLVVLYDDIDLPLGSVRLKERGGAGSHRGMQSIINHLGSQDFNRIRIGFGPQDRSQDIVNVVLAPIDKSRQDLAFQGLTRAADCLERLLTSGCQQAMMDFNSKD